MGEAGESDGIHAAVVVAELDLAAGTDPAAVGATVSDELCGSWDHEGPCRWPHRNEIEAVAADVEGVGPAVEAGGGTARFRTVVVAPAEEMPQVRERIELALRRDPRWSVVSAATRPPSRDEGELVDHLIAVPRLVV